MPSATRYTSSVTWFFLDGAPPRLVSTLWRTAQAFVPRLARADDAFAARVLPRAEYALYRRMDVRDRAHACGVARALLTLEPAAPSTLLRAALLHDVGKSGRRYRPLERILVALYTPARCRTRRACGGCAGRGNGGATTPATAPS